MPELLIVISVIIFWVGVMGILCGVTDRLYGLALVSAVVAGVAALVLFGSMMDMHQLEIENCEKLGGHLVDTGRGNICVSDDGLILESDR